ncbi:MAG: ppGpp synthetase [Treponematales bacterium]
MEHIVPPTMVNELQKSLCCYLDKCGLFYRVFSRAKSDISIKTKISIKNYSNGKKMQDLIGLRVVLYFKDDVDICRKIIENSFSVNNISEDQHDTTTFSPTRLNIVCNMPTDISQQIPEKYWDDNPIDRTFEIQVRTIFSEGWHEVEHDLRYKCEYDWDACPDMSRTLNGIFATLETCDWSILQIFDKLAYQMYKNQNWTAMIRNKFRLRFMKNTMSENIRSLLDNEKNNISKTIVRIERTQLMLFLSDPNTIVIPVTMDNIIYIINALFIHDSSLNALTPAKILEETKRYKLTP